MRLIGGRSGQISCVAAQQVGKQVVVRQPLLAILVDNNALHNILHIQTCPYRPYKELSQLLMHQTASLDFEVRPGPTS